MKKVINAIFYTGLALLLLFADLSCRGHRGGPEGLTQFVENPEHGLRKTVTVGPCAFTFQYKPAAYMLSLEHHRHRAAEKGRLRQLDSMAWFNVFVQISGYSQSPLKYAAKDMDEYRARLNYYLNDAGHDFSLVCGRDTLPVAAYWFEDNQGLTPTATMIVGFRLRNARTVKHDLKIAYYDRVFRCGIIRTIIQVKDINALPGESR